MKSIERIMEGFGIGVVLMIVAAIFACIPAFATHVITCLVRVFDGSGDAVATALILVVGVVIPPIGVVHGWLIWFGVA